jgi:hypothetical protein
MQRESGEPGEGEEEHRGEKPFGAVGIVVLIVLVGGGIFLVLRLSDMSSVQDCVWSGRRNCAPVDVPSGR